MDCYSAESAAKPGAARFTMSSYPQKINPKHVNHDLSPRACPVSLDTVDLFGDFAPEHWYEAYEIPHRDYQARQ